MCAVALLSSCHIYTKYERPEQLSVKGLYRDTANVSAVLPGTAEMQTADSTNFGNLPWKEVFTDGQLQALIDTALTHNVDLLTAALNVKQSEAQLGVARLAFIPSLSLTPSGTLSSWNGGKATQTYSLPVSASWTVDLFGSLLNAKRSAQAQLLQMQSYQQAVRTKLIANVANSYYTLLMLDRQLTVTQETAVLWKESVETMRKLKDVGQSNEASIASYESNYLQVAVSIPELERQIRETENALSLILGQAPQLIKRSTMEAQQLPAKFTVGIPVQMLSNRPDVYQAEMNLAASFYDTNRARSAFYPSISLTGQYGWTNSAGNAILNPGKMLASAVASLTQPIFSNGQLTAKLKIAKAQQEAAYLAFQQSVLSAGSEVSNALSLYQTSKEKSELLEQRVAACEKAADFTQRLFNLGTSSYLEVLTARQSLLSAKLDKVSDEFYKMQAIVNLYYALGGGR